MLCLLKLRIGSDLFNCLFRCRCHILFQFITDLPLLLSEDVLLNMFTSLVNSVARFSRVSGTTGSRQLFDLNESALRSFATKATTVKRAAAKAAPKKVGKSKASPKVAAKAKPKKPVKPKRVPSAFNLYVKDQFPKYKQRDAKAKAPQVMTQLALAWKRLSQTEKAPFQQSAAQMKKQKEELVKLKKASSGPLNGYAQFVKDNYSKVKAQNPSVPSTGIIKKLAVIWKGMPQSDRSLRLKEAANARDQFKKIKSSV
eukprot:TRINITY_DN1713_c0_g1_i2.p1 TRINITY_DN1713_c0_g1~~TRINITY_DN1713_c0_g1_i2.p1  ORF type:complete len:256 (-),score=13.22 TRINITY_DN1713_c0_g1_i2:258-1025(-)